MTHIEQMIQDLCPQGVEFKKLGEVTYWDKRFNEVERSMQPQIRKYHYYLASELEDLESPTGTIKILYTSNKIAYAEEETVAENVVDAEVVAIPWGGNANIKYFKGKFVTADNRIAVVRDTSILSTKFVYYWLKQNQEEIDSYYRGAGIKHPSMLKVLSFEIPIPPMEVQKRIVTVLDAYSALAAELQAELQMRRKQYEYYRTQLLTPHSESNSADKSDDCNWVITTLGEIGTFTRGRRFVRTDIVDEGQPCIHYGDMYTYYGIATDHARTHLPKDFPVKLRYAEKGDVIIVGAGENDMDIGVGCVWEGDEPVAVHDACYIFKHNQYPRYISHYLRTLDYHLQIKKNVSTAKICAISPEGISKAKIALPPLEEQKRIADFLDKFEVLLNSLSDGIPAEQAAQQKRYEYYRDLLLTFDRKAE